jgi:SAM-dependent methyltransferase
VALHHFPDQPAAIREWARCLKPGGRLALVDNIGPEEPAANAYINAFETLRDPSHGHVYPLAELARFIEAAGLTLLSADSMRKPMLFHPWMTRMQVSPPDRVRLTQMLWESQDAAREFLNPLGEGAETTFDLREGLFLARKPEQ